MALSRWLFGAHYGILAPLCRPDDYEAAKGKYIIDTELMKLLPKDAVVMHPLPRVDEVGRAGRARWRALGEARSVCLHSTTPSAAHAWGPGSSGLLRMCCTVGFVWAVGLLGS